MRFLRLAQLVSAALSLLAAGLLVHAGRAAKARFGEPLHQVSESTRGTLRSLRVSTGQLSQELDHLPATLAASERASRSSAAAVRLAQKSSKEICIQLSKTAVAMNDGSGQLMAASKNAGAVADKLPDFGPLKDAREAIYKTALAIQAMAPQLSSISVTLTNSVRNLDAPLQASLTDAATAIDAAAAQTASFRTGVIPTLPKVLTALTDNLDAYINALDTLPQIIDLLRMICFGLACGFAALALSQAASFVIWATAKRRPSSS